MAKPTINWLEAKQEFFATKDLSLRDISKKYRISYSRVSKVAMEDRWIDEKNKIWNKAEQEAIVETEGSVKDLLKRHSKVARFLQGGSLTNLQKIIKVLKEYPELEKSIVRLLKKDKLVDIAKLVQALTGMAGEGLKAERELYPKQMKLEADGEIKIGEISDELKQAVHETLIKRITGKPRTNIKPS